MGRWQDIREARLQAQIERRWARKQASNRRFNDRMRGMAWVLERLGAKDEADKLRQQIATDEFIDDHFETLRKLDEEPPQ